MEENQNCTTHLEELNEPTKLIECGEVPLSHVTLDLLGLLDGHLFERAGIGGESVLCLEAVHVVEAKVSNQGHVYKHNRQDDGEGRVLAVDAVETSLDDGHRGIAILEDVVEARIVGGAEVGHV